MVQNIFMPKGLPLLSDDLLIRTCTAYRHSFSLLARTETSATRETREQLEGALQAIETELRARGFRAQDLEPVN